MLRFARRLLSLPVQPRHTRPIRCSKIKSDPFRPQFDNLEERVVPDGRPHPLPIIYIGSGGGMAPIVRAYDVDKGTVTFEKQVYESAFTGGVRVATGDITLDGVPDLIVAPGPGGGSRIRVLDGVTGNEISGPLGNFFAYDSSFTGGVFVASADVDGDTIPDVLTAAGLGGGPHIKVFSGKTGELIQSFFAFDPNFRGGSTIGAADFTGDGIAELIIGAGPGGGPHVRVFNAVTGQQISGPLGSFFAFDPDNRSGINVNTDTQAGDVTGDKQADIIVGLGAGVPSQVKVFDGKSGAEARSFSPFASDMTAGVRVATAYVTDDQYADIVVATGPGTPGTVRVFDGLSMAKIDGPMGEFQPFAGADTGGLYVGASNDPVVTSIYVTSQFGPVVTNQTLAFQATASAQKGLPAPTGTIDFYGTNSSGGSIYLGTAPLLTDPAGSGVSVAGIIIPASQFDGDGINAGVSIQYSGDSNYANYGYFTPGYVSINSAIQPGCACASNTSEGEGGSPSPSPKMASGVGVSGTVMFPRTSLVGQTGSAADSAEDNTGTLGTTNQKTSNISGASGDDEIALYMNNQLGTTNPNGSSIALVDGGSPKVFFDRYAEYGSLPLPAGTFHPRNGAPYGISEDSANYQIVVTDAKGTTYRFWDFSSGNGGKIGRLQSKTSPDGSHYDVISWGADDKPSETQTTVGTGSSAITESILSSVSGSVNTKTLRRKVGSGAWVTVRSADTYNVNNSSLNQVQTIRDSSGNALDTTYYRFESKSGYGGQQTSTGRVKFAFSSSSYARLVAALGTNVNTLTDTQLSSYADQYYEYNSDGRVTRAVISGAGCSICSAGQGEYTYTYSLSYTSPNPAPTRVDNVWIRKVVETQPDSSTNTYYLDGQDRLLFKISADGTYRSYHYDTSGRLILEAEPSAISGYSESLADLVGFSGSSATYLNDHAGLIHTYTYASTTTATDTTAGDVKYYLKQTAIRQGDLGTDVPQSAMTYIQRTATSGSYYFPATQTHYRNDDGTGAQTTSESYTWLGSTAQPASITVTLPTVTTAQNGPNSATSTTTVFDSIGRPIWSKDAAGFLSYTAYDDATGAVVKTITDVNTANTSDFANLPSGWSTPSGGGLHLISTFEVDNLGRTTKSTAPNGRVDYTVYNDANHEVRYYPGWNSSTNLPTGPTSVSREDRTNGYSESLTMSATPTVSGGRPTGTEAISSLQSLSRSYRNLAGQVTTSDSYFNLSGLTYSTAVNIGTLNTNYYRSTTDYGKQNGQTNRQVSPLGTITRTEFDSAGRPISSWVGTDDTPTTGYWATNNLAGTDMTKVSEYEYDSDGNNTKVTQFPGGGAANRVTQTFFDWRDRPVAVKSGVETSESTSTNRPISYTDYDNLGEVTKSRMYDGDSVTITSTSGVPNAPSSSLLRSQSTTSYDELGRVYLSETYSVDPSSGSVGTNTLKSNTWYDARGMVIKTSSPGGLVQKTVYDGAGRVTTSYATDGGGDTSYSDASNVTGDKVFEQNETAYDASGNVLSQTIRQRNHDTTGTGALGTASTGNLARVSYSAMYYDAGDRLTATANYGTNGASSWTRNSTVPTRSDTILVTSFEYDSAGQQWKVTDPKAIESRTYFDAVGRTTKTIENYVDGTVGDDNDKTTEYTYNSAGMTTLKADLTGGGSQTSEWVYGVTTGGGSTINSNDVIVETRWPDPSTGASSNSQKDIVTINALGQTLTSTDRSGTVHTLAYDVLGRVTTDTVTTLGTNIDGSVRRVETAYDGQGNKYLLTNYNATTSGSIVNQVQRSYNGLSQLTVEWQSHSGAVNTGTTPKVQYAYSEMASGANHSRPTSMTYPNGRVVTYDYGTGGSLNDTISRLNDLKDGSTTLEAYDYLGVGSVVRRSHPQSDVELSYVKLSSESVGDAGDQYTGLDRFGRIVDERWITAANGVAVDRYQYTYDRDGNRLTRTNALNSALNESYGYDNLNQLTSSSVTGTSKSWDYDALGNWDGVTTNGSTQTRTANRQNEITSISGATTPTYDAAGNMTTDETGKQYVYDAWNRQVTVKNSGGTTIASYAYDTMNRRVFETVSSVTTDLYYSSQWQVLEERVSGSAVKSYVWSPVYVDAMVARDRDTDANGSLDERLYVTQDANFNVTALVNASGTVVERVTYDPYGTVTTRSISWVQTSETYLWQYLFKGGRLIGGNLYDFRYRNYSPTLGRWLSNDPMQYMASDKDLYRSFANSPLVYEDPTGQCVENCGADVTKKFKKLMNNFEKKFTALKKSEQVRLAYESTTPFGWDIDQLYNVDHDDKKRGNFNCPGVATHAYVSDCEWNVTINNKCVFAGYLNYYLWGRLYRLASNAIIGSTVSLYCMIPDSDLRTRTFDDGSTDMVGTFPQEYNLQNAIEFMKRFRHYAHPDRPDTLNRERWITAGWAGELDNLPDAYYQSKFPSTEKCSPCSGEYKGKFDIRLGQKGRIREGVIPNTELFAVSSD